MEDRGRAGRECRGVQPSRGGTAQGIRTDPLYRQSGNVKKSRDTADLHHTTPHSIDVFHDRLQGFRPSLDLSDGNRRPGDERFAHTVNLGRGQTSLSVLLRRPPIACPAARASWALSSMKVDHLATSGNSSLTETTTRARDHSLSHLLCKARYVTFGSTKRPIETFPRHEKRYLAPTATPTKARPSAPSPRASP